MAHRILIAGCGYVGAALGECLAGQGHTVFGLRRNPHALSGAIIPVTADLADASTMRALPEGIDVVFYTAGADGFSEDAYQAAYVQGMRNLIDALRAAPPRRILFTSSTGVYAQTGGGWVDEESPTEPTSFSGQCVLEGERLLRASGIPSVTLRLGGIYGPGRTRLIDRVRDGEATLEAGPARYLNLVHRDDAVGALMHLMNLDDPEPICLGVDDEPQEWNALIAWLAETLDVPAPERGGESQTRGRPVRNRRCSNARLRASGYAFRYPSVREGYAELIEATKDRYG